MTKLTVYPLTDAARDQVFFRKQKPSEAFAFSLLAFARFLLVFCDRWLEDSCCTGSSP